MMAHHCVITSSLHKILKIDKFGYISCDIDYNSRTYVFRDVFHVKTNQCDLRRPKCASSQHKVAR